MAVELFTNQGSTTVSSGGTTAPSSGTSESWTVASSASFPAISGSQQFHVADPASATAAAEIIAVTAVSGTTWTVTRGAESTTPVAHQAGFTVQNLISAASLSTFAQAGNGDLGGTGIAATVAKLQGTTLSAPSGGATAFLNATGGWSIPGVQALTFTFGSTGGVPSSGTFTAGTVAVDQNQVPRVCTSSGTPGTWRRLYAQPYDFYVDDYGAKGDGVLALVTTVAGNATITAASAVFTSTAVDGGKNIMICGAGGAVPGGPDIDTISTITDSTHAVLTSTVPAGGSGSGLACVFSSDDRTAIDNCITAAQAYAVAHNYFARVLFSDKIYGTGTGLFQSVAGVSGAVLSYNAQIRMAVPADLTGKSNKLEIQYLGPDSPSGAHDQFWVSANLNVQGAAVVSYSSGPNTADATFGQQAIMQMPIGGTGVISSPVFFNVKAVVKGLTFVQPGWSNSIGLDIGTAGQHDLAVVSTAFAPSTTQGGGVNPYTNWFSVAFWINNKIAVGVRLSNGQNNDGCESDICVQGLNVAVSCQADHVLLNRLSVAAVDVALKLLNVSGNAQHDIHARVSAENYNSGLVITGTGSRVACYINWDAEMTSTTIAGSDVSDANNELYGTFNWSDFSRATSGLANIIVPAVSGAANLHIVNNQLNRQVYDAHAYAYTLGTAFQNPWWADMWIILSGGTTTGLLIGPTSATATTSMGTTTPASFKLPSGWWLNIQGSVKPTTFNAVPS